MWEGEKATESIREQRTHVFVGEDHVVLGSHVIGDVVVKNQTQETIEKGQIDLKHRW